MSTPATARLPGNLQPRVVEYEKAPVCVNCTRTHLDFEDCIGAMLIAKLALRRIIRSNRHVHVPNNKECPVCLAVKALEDMKP